MHQIVHLLITLLSVSSAQIPPWSILEDLFQWKNVEVLNFKSCSVHDDLKLFINLAQKKRYLIRKLSSSDVPQCEPYRVAILVDVICLENVEYLKEISSLNIFNGSYSWILSGQNDSILHHLRHTSIALNSDVTLISPQQLSKKNAKIMGYDDSALYLYDIYRQLPNSALIIQECGVWSSEGRGLQLVPFTRVESLNGAKLKGGMTFFDESYYTSNLHSELQNRSNHPEIDTGNKIAYALELHMTDFVNYTLELRVAPEWGQELPNGTYTGMVGDVVNGVTNLTIGSIKMTSERRHLVEYLSPYASLTFPIFLKQPRKIGSYKALFLQFHSGVWILIGVIMIASITTLTLIHWAKSSFGGMEVQRETKPSVIYSMVAVVSALSLQGFPVMSSALSGRMACFFILMLGYMISTYYNASTMNALLSPTPLSIRTLNQFIESKIPLILVDLKYNRIKKSKQKILYPEVVDKHEKSNGLLLSIEEGSREILKGKAFSADIDVILPQIRYNFSDMEKCDLTILSSGPVTTASNMLPKNAAYREIMFKGTLRMKEHGLVDRQTRYWRLDKPECLVKQQWLWVSMETASLGFAIISFGLVLSFITLLIEKIHFNLSS